jgi:hypothetical protein
MPSVPGETDAQSFRVTHILDAYAGETRIFSKTVTSGAFRKLRY